MEFELELFAKTTDPGGIDASFKEQLAQFGETKETTVISTKGPYRVDSSGGQFYFEVRRVYKIVL